MDQKREERVAVLDSTTSKFDKALTSWKPEVDTLLSFVKLKLTKLNSYFDHDARSTSNPKLGVLQLGSTTAHTSLGGVADGPNGHRIKNWNRDCGFGTVFTQIHDPVKGTVYTSPPPLQSPHTVGFYQGQDSFKFSNSMGQRSRMQLVKLPKMNFPKFDGDNPKLWKSHCEDYFEMYGVDPLVWVKVSSMHFEGTAARWLQSIDHKVRHASWSELCSWIHERFGKDQHEILIRQLYRIKQSGSVPEYVDQFCELIDQLKAYSKDTNPLYYTTRFIDGLKDDIKSVVLVQRPRYCLLLGSIVGRVCSSHSQVLQEI
jgi:hypothetical protein